jgi:hypothetical protein
MLRSLLVLVVLSSVAAPTGNGKRKARALTPPLPDDDQAPPAQQLQHVGEAGSTFEGEAGAASSSSAPRISAPASVADGACQLCYGTHTVKVCAH